MFSIILHSFNLHIFKLAIFHDMKTSQNFYIKSAKLLPALTVAKMYPAEYLPARRGGRHLKDENEMVYYLNRRRDSKTYYCCIEKSRLKCPATAVVENETNMIIKKSGEHVHDSNLLKRAVRQLENQAIKNAAENRDVPRSVLGNLNIIVSQSTNGKHSYFYHIISQ